MTSKFLVIILLLTSFMYAQELEFVEQDISINQNIDGTLLMPKTEKPPLVILISGSGVNDRNGNSNMVKGDMLKKLAYALAKNNIASYRYDKRSFKQIKERTFDENMIFDHFIEDAVSSVSFFKSKTTFSSVYVLGHSQGSLVGMLAAQEGIDGFISVSGPAFSIDQTITTQVTTSSPIFGEKTRRVFETLKQGKPTDEFPPELISIFDKRNQPFLISWMKYNPQEEIKKLDIPILIVNGTNDFQVSEKDARLLHEAQPKSTLKIIKNLNHALIIFEGNDKLANMKSYSEIQRPLSQELINSIVAFMK